MFEKEDYRGQARETRSRPYYKHSMNMFSPRQTGILPRPAQIHLDTTVDSPRRNPYTDVQSRYALRQDKQVPSLQPRSKSSFGASYSQILSGGHYVKGEEPSSSAIAEQLIKDYRQSALSKYAAENRSSHSQILRESQHKSRHCRDQHHFAKNEKSKVVRVTTTEENYSTLDDDQSSSQMHSYAYQQLNRRAERRAPGAVTSLLQQSRSSSNVLRQVIKQRQRSRSRTSISGSRLDTGKSDVRQRHSREERCSLQNETTDNSRQISSKKRKECHSRQRTLKDCKNELKQDRMEKAKKRKSTRDAAAAGKTKQSRKKSRRPEVVVVYRYPQHSSTHRTSTTSGDQMAATPHSSTYVTEDGGASMVNALHQQLQREYSEDKIVPYLQRSGYAGQVLTTSTMTKPYQMYIDSSAPISPSELQVVKLPQREEVSRAKRDISKSEVESLTESAEQIIQNYLRKEKKRKSKRQHRSSETSESREKRKRSSHRLKSRDYHDQQRKACYKNDDSAVGKEDGGAAARGVNRHHRIEDSYYQQMAPTLPLNPLTSSELADSYLEQPSKSQLQKQQPLQKRSNGALLYYQQQREKTNQVLSSAISSRPQEVLVSDRNSLQHAYKQTTTLSDARLSFDSRAQSIDEASSKRNLVSAYQQMLTQQEQAYKTKMQELEIIKNQVQETAAQISRVHECRMSREKMRKSQSRKRSRSIRNKENSVEKEEMNVKEEDLSTEKRFPHKPRSKLGQRYISYLQRNKRAEEAARQAREHQSRNEQPQQQRSAEKQSPRSKSYQPYQRHETEAPLLRKQLMQVHKVPCEQQRLQTEDNQRVTSPQQQTRTSPSSFYPRHKSVDNVKQYAISKIIGRLNTKSAMEHVYQQERNLKEARRIVDQMHSRYPQAEHALKTAPLVRSSSQLHQDNDSTSSFIQRLQKFHNREVSNKFNSRANDLYHQSSQQRFSEKRSQSHIDFHSSVARFNESRNELIPEAYRSQYPMPEQPSFQQVVVLEETPYYGQEDYELQDSNQRGETQHQQNYSNASYYTLGGQTHQNSQDQQPKLSEKVFSVLNSAYPQKSDTSTGLFYNPIRKDGSTLPTPYQPRESSPLRNRNHHLSSEQLLAAWQPSQSVIDQDDFENKLLNASQMQELMSRADQALKKSSEHLQQISYTQNQSGHLQLGTYPGLTTSMETNPDDAYEQSHLHKQNYEQPNQIQPYFQQQHVSSGLATDSGHDFSYRLNPALPQDKQQSDATSRQQPPQQHHQESYNASLHFSHRIAELQRQTNEIQKLPEIYNERIMSIKKRTLEVNEAALSYASGDKVRGGETALHGGVAALEAQRRFVQFEREDDYRDEDRSRFSIPDGEDLNISQSQHQEDHHKYDYPKEETEMLEQQDLQLLQCDEQLSDNQRQQQREASDEQTQEEQQTTSNYFKQHYQKLDEMMTNTQSAIHSRFQSLGHGSRGEQHSSSQPGQSQHFGMTATQPPSLEQVNEHRNHEQLQMNSTTRNQRFYENRTQTSMLAVERPTHIQVLSQEITMNHDRNVDSSTQHKTQNFRKDEFENIKQLRGGQTSSNRTTTQHDGPQTTTYTATTEVAQEDHKIAAAAIADDKKKRNKERRRMKRERKLRQLKELHEKAQLSINHIASGLSSQAVSGLVSQRGQEMKTYDFANNETYSNQVFTPATDQLQNHEETTRVRSTVEKLANTRKEIKRLIKIQNKHSKLLRQLQKSGVVDDSEQSQLKDSQTSHYSISEMSDSQKQLQMAQNTGLLRQMQDIFKYLAQIQQKLDYEIEERKLRTGQVSAGGEAQLSSHSNLPLQMQQHESNHDQQVGRRSQGCYVDVPTSLNRKISGNEQKLVHTQQNSQNQQFFGNAGLSQINSCQQSVHQNNLIASNKTLSQGTTSTLFWDTQMAYNNQAMFAGLKSGATTNQNSILNSGTLLPTLSNNNGNHDHYRGQEITGSQENADVRTTLSDQDSSVQRKDNKGVAKSDLINAEDKQQQVGSLTQRTEPDELEFSAQNIGQAAQQLANCTVTVTSEQLQSQQPTGKTCNFQSTQDGVTFDQTANSLSLNGIRVEQLCEILSREISKVREESVQQAYDMRFQYEQELMQLRAELYQKTHPQFEMAMSPHYEQHNLQQFANQAMAKDLVQQRQMELFNCTDEMATEQATQRMGMPPHQVMAPMTQMQDQSAMNDYYWQFNNEMSHRYQPLVQENEEDECEEPHPMPHTVFLELEKVKAERDDYFAKLMRVKSRIAQSKLSNRSATAAGFQSQTEQTERSFASNNQMSGSFNKRADGNVGTDNNSLQNEYQANSHTVARQTSSQQPVKHQAGMYVETTEGTQQMQNLHQYQTDFNVSSLPSSQNHANQAVHPRDFSDLAKHEQFNNLNGMSSLESNPSCFTVAQKRQHNQSAIQHSQQHASSTGQTMKQESGPCANGQQNRQKGISGRAGKIVHQWRTFEDTQLQQEKAAHRDSSVGSKTKHAAGEILCRKPSKYVNVRHNRTSMLRQNRAASRAASGLESSSVGKRCNSCMMSSIETGAQAAGANSKDLSFKSNRSSTSQTRKVSSINQNGAIMSSIGGGRSSSNECTMCHNKLGSALQVTTTPFGLSKESTCGPAAQATDSNLINAASAQSSSSNRRMLQAQQKRPRTPCNESNLSTSNLGHNSTFSSRAGAKTDLNQESHINALPSAAIGGRQTLQTMIPRSPDLLSRLAAEHEQLYQNNQVAMVVAESSFDMQKEHQQQTGGSINEDNQQHSQSRALQVIQHYLDKYDKQ